MSNENIWKVTMGMGSMMGIENITGDDEFEGLKDHDIEEVAQMDIHVSQNPGVVPGGYEDHQSGSISISDHGGRTSGLVHAVPINLISL